MRSGTGIGFSNPGTMGEIALGSALVTVIQILDVNPSAVSPSAIDLDFRSVTFTVILFVLVACASAEDVPKPASRMTTAKTVQGTCGFVMSAFPELASWFVSA